MMFSRSIKVLVFALVIFASVANNQAEEDLELQKSEKLALDEDRLPNLKAEKVLDRKKSEKLAPQEEEEDLLTNFKVEEDIELQEPEKLDLKEDLLPNLKEEKEEDYGLEKSERCTQKVCQPPNCRCSDSKFPSKELKNREKQTPQFITVTFDDALNVLNYPIYEELFANLVNPDECKALGTFFVSHEYTDYTRVNALYNEGHEIALHSITHSVDMDYWRNATVDLILREFGGEMKMLETFAMVKKKDIHGMRLPFLQIAGNNTYEAARILGLTYDSSWPTQKRIPPMWPYTLDYRSTQECPIGPCPDASIPGLWVSPMVTWLDVNNFACAMMDSCSPLPKNEVNEIFEWMLENFNRHYESNRAPFGMYLHSAWFGRHHNYFKAFRKFLEHVNLLPDVYITTMSQVMKYMRNPVVGKPFQSCPVTPDTDECIPSTCVLTKASTNEKRYMTICGKCPVVYPWLDNPLGKLL